MAATGLDNDVAPQDAESARNKNITSMIFFALHILSASTSTLEPLVRAVAFNSQL